MTTSIQSLALIQPVISGQIDDAWVTGALDQDEWQAAGSAALNLGLLTRAAMASSYMILGFLVYALNLWRVSGLCRERPERTGCPDNQSVFNWLV